MNHRNNVVSNAAMDVQLYMQLEQLFHVGRTIYPVHPARLPHIL